jgi:ribosomal protein S18 acetylase RimI-like enzyme
MEPQSEVTIRPATTDDADAIGQVHVDSWRGAYAGLVADDYLASLDPTKWAAMWREQVASQHGTLLVAEDESRILGFAQVGISRDEDAEPGTHEIYAIYFTPSAWGHGAARALMRTLLGDLPVDTTVTLWTLADNERARHFYLRSGFSPDGVERFDEIGGTDCLEVRYRRG